MPSVTAPIAALAANTGAHQTAPLSVATGAPALAQAPVLCPGSPKCSLAKAPAAGDILSVVITNGDTSLANATVTDSLGNRLTRATITPNCSTLGHCAAVFDEVVAGSPGNSITISNDNYQVALYDIAGASYPGTYASTDTGGTPTTLAATLGAVKANDLQLCGYIQPTPSVGNLKLTYTSGSSVYDSDATIAVVAHAWATTTASSTCTAANIIAKNAAAMAYADYSVTPAVAVVPTLKQAPTCISTGNTFTFGTAPQNGDRVTYIAGSYASLSGASLTDSNGSSSPTYTQRLLWTNNSSNYGNLIDGFVANSPTATYSVANPAGIVGCMFDSGPATSATYQTATGTASKVTLTLPSTAAGDLIECFAYAHSAGNPTMASSAGSLSTGAPTTNAVWGYQTAPAAGPTTITVTNLLGYESALGCADYSNATVAVNPTPTPAPTPTPLPTATPTAPPSGAPAPNTITYNATNSCVAGSLYTNNVLPAGVGEFGTNGLNRSYWGGVKTRTVGIYAGTWGPGFLTSWGRHQYDTYFGDSSDGLGLDPFTVTNDTAVAGSPQGLRITAEPMPSNLANSLTVMANDQWIVTSAATPFNVPTEGGSLTVNVANPNNAQNNWKVGMGYANGAITFIGTLTKGGATPSGNGTGGSNPWTISNIHIYSGAPGTTITPGANDEGGFRTYFFPAYYSGVLDTNVNLQYGLFMARVRLPAFLPALSPAFWTLETGGVLNGPAGLQRDELDIQEMFGNTSGNSMNAGEILWNSTPATSWPTPTGIYGFPNGTPQSAYHDYGVLLTPGSTTFYLDGAVIASHSGGPDWTQGSPDKEIMLMFQVGAPGTWLDPSSQGANDSWPQYYWTQWIRIFQPTSTHC